MQDLKTLTKDELVSKLIDSHDLVRNQASRYANAMGSQNEPFEKHTFEQLTSNFKEVEAEILRRMP